MCIIYYICLIYVPSSLPIKKYIYFSNAILAVGQAVPTRMHNKPHVNLSLDLESCSIAMSAYISKFFRASD